MNNLLKLLNGFILFIKEVFVKNNKESDYTVKDVDNFILADFHDGMSISKAINIIVAIIFFLCVFITWAYFFNITEVSKGNGKVIPSSKEKVIQSLDGGVLVNLNVNEGQMVNEKDIIAQLDTTRIKATIEESESKYRFLLAQRARLLAEMNNKPLIFPEQLNKYEELVDNERKLYNSRRENFNTSLENINNSRSLLNSELQINTKLMKQGASSKIDIIRIKKQIIDLNVKEIELRYNYFVKSREDVSKISSEIDYLQQKVIGGKDLLSKATIRSPVRGIVKNIEINTIGGVVPPNGVLMNIVPLDDGLFVEARISPRDIAFIYPGQDAIVKFTAYDYSIYGALSGKVVTISPDTIKDEIKQDLLYYRIYIRTNKDFLTTGNNKKHFISPGMVASVDIKTGEKTVLQYLIKPFNKVNEAIRER